MESNPYRPPRAELDHKHRPPGSIAKAIGVGVAIEVVGTLLVGVIAGVIYGVVLASQGQRQDEIERVFASLEPFSAFGLVTSFFGLLISLYAGYQCAAIANRNTYLAPGILAVVSTTLGAAFGAQSYSTPGLLLVSGITVIAVLGGARIHIRRLDPA